MKAVDLNLADRPFVNLRPIKRVALLLWLVGTGLSAVNGMLYWRHFSGRSDQSALLDEVERRIEEERAEIARLQSELSLIDLDWQNRQVVMLNSRIDERTFSWSTLFDRLAEVLPREVQLRRVTPRIREADERRRGAARTGTPERSATVDLDLDGLARSGEDLLEFVDALFAHPSFHEPDLVREARRDNATEFSLTVSYLQERLSEETLEETPEVTELQDGRSVTAGPLGAGRGPAARPDPSGQSEDEGIG